MSGVGLIFPNYGADYVWSLKSWNECDQFLSLIRNQLKSQSLQT